MWACSFRVKPGFIQFSFVLVKLRFIRALEDLPGSGVWLRHSLQSCSDEGGQESPHGAEATGKAPAMALRLIFQAFLF